MRTTIHNKILSYMWENKGKWFKVSDFAKQNSKCFVGYEAGTRLCDLQRDGFIESRKCANGNFKEYTIVSIPLETYKQIKNKNTDKKGILQKIFNFLK